jgi:MFS transporter, FHS family, glucose/mannose:H+ symporter
LRNFPAGDSALSGHLSCATLACVPLMAERETASLSALPDQLEKGSSISTGAARSEWVLLHVGFVAVGIITTLIGNVLPSFIHHWSLSDSQAGFLIGAQFTGSTIGTLLTSMLLPRFGFTRVLCAGFLSFAVGFTFLGIGPWFVTAIAVFVYGFGYGLANPATNLRATQLPSKNVASAVTFLNFSWTVGAVSCPFLVGQLLPRIGIRGIAISLLIVSAVIAAFHFTRHSSATDSVPQRFTRPIAEWLHRLGQAPSFSLLLIFFLYVGTEVATGNWVATQERRLPASAGVVLLLAPSFFYGFLLLGRAVSPVLLRHCSSVFISVAGLVSAAAGTLIIILAHQPHWLFLGAALAGFGCAPQYPIFITWLAQTFGKDSTWVSALFFAGSSAGGAVLPWLVGIVGAQTGSLRTGFVLPLVACVVMILSVLRSRPRAQAPVA